MATREERVKERIKTSLRKYRRLLQKAADEDINEADTRIIVNSFLSEVLGYDQFFEITSEYRINKQYADYVLKIDKKPKIIVEAKAINIELKRNHLRQASGYATDEGIEWIVLTNGNIWELYYVKFSKPIEKHLVFSVDILAKHINARKRLDFLYLLTKESVVRDELQDFWDKKCNLCAANVRKVLFSEPVLRRMRLDLAKLTGYKIDNDDLEHLLKTEVVRPGIH